MLYFDAATIPISISASVSNSSICFRFEFEVVAEPNDVLRTSESSAFDHVGSLEIRLAQDDRQITNRTEADLLHAFGDFLVGGRKCPVGFWNHV